MLRAVSFRRALGPFDATMVVVGGIIGAGIFINPALVAQRLASGRYVLAAWIAGGVIALIGALAFAELAALFPKAGGQYVYLREAYHPFVGFLFGWATLLLIQGGGLAAVSITFGEYALRLAEGDTRLVRPIAIAAIALLALVNCLGVKPGSRLLNVFVLLKVAALALLIGAGLASAGGPPAPAVAPAVPGSFGLLGFGAALVPILFSYGGWQSVNVIAEEVREPRRTLPAALLAGTAIVVVVYVAVNLVYLKALGRDGLASTLTPAADAVRQLFGAGTDRFLAAAIAISTFGFLDLTLLAPTRISYAMAQDRLFPAWLARLHPRFGTPLAAILLLAGWGIVLVLTGTYGDLVDAVVFGDWIFFGLAVAALVIFRRRFPLGQRDSGSFRVPGYPVLPALFVAAALFVVVSVVRANPVRSAVGAGLLATGVPVYLFFARRKEKEG
jgi:basic amino acid/polyamine antiporter, APA family